MQRRAADEAVLGCSCRAETSYIKWASGRLNRPCNASGVMWTRLEGGPHHLVRSFPYQYLMFQTILLYFAAVGRPKGVDIGCGLVDLTWSVKTRDPQAIVRDGIGPV
ncbi:hypothetical protein C4D60_Mb06t22770 [Musa balbisiana]|uniref:Uncharacterized protein n=1 Tax=Musa balbisiana TaxID=52838 RepID=A0A4S8ISH2_MUSBA|nr:hypothetical protein C4D60_Mb06t22770 [Musa balbisiana]